MATASIDHDRLFKELIRTFFLEFCRLFLQPLADSIDPGSIEFLDKEFFSDVPGADRHEADLVVKVKWRNTTACFVIHIESQAQHQPGFNRRMYLYFTRLHELLGLPVYPVVLFSFDSPRLPQPHDYTVTFPDLDVLRFNYRVIQLNQLSWRDYLNNPNPVASAVMAKMRIAPADRPHVKLQCLRLLTTLKLDPARMHLISAFVDAYLRLNPAEERQYQQELESQPRQSREAIMEYITSWEQKGIDEGLIRGRSEGRTEGISQGRSEGVRAIVLRLLRRRFKTLPRGIAARLQEMPVAEVESLGEALLDFGSRPELDAWLAQH